MGYLLQSFVGPVLTVTLNRPEVHNAFDEALIGELTDAFEHVRHNREVRVIVLTGAGQSFCAGADLAWMERMVAYSREENVTDAQTLQWMLEAVAACPQVTIARVHGAAMGGGAGLVAACDVGVAVDGATFAFSEVRLGLIPAVIAPYVVRKVGRGAAQALFVTGERFGAADAHRLGLVQRVAAGPDLDGAVAEAVKQALAAGPEAVTAVKRLLRDIDSLTPEAAAPLTVERIAAARVGAEGQEGIRAFLEKRKPGWVM